MPARRSTVDMINRMHWFCRRKNGTQKFKRPNRSMWREFYRRSNEKIWRKLSTKRRKRKAWVFCDDKTISKRTDSDFVNLFVQIWQRSELLEKLASVQLPANDLKKFASIISVQTQGLKKFSQGEGLKTAHTFSADVEENDGEQKRWSSIAGKKRKERLALLHG